MWLYAQGTTSIGLSDKPSAQELAELFTSRDISPDSAVNIVASKGENAIGGLTTLLFSDSIRSSKLIPASITSGQSQTKGNVSVAGQQATCFQPPNKIFVVLTLGRLHPPMHLRHWCRPLMSIVILKYEESHSTF